MTARYSGGDRPSMLDFEGYGQGDPGSPITLIEYGDFECPACQQAFPAVSQLVDRHQDKVRFIFRHFPQKEMHPHALLAAEASEAAGAQGSFWEFYGMMFARLRPLDMDLVLDFAAALDLDINRFVEDLTLHTYMPRILRHVESARQMGIRGTPGFLLNGRFIDTSFGFDRLSTEVHQALAYGD